MKNTIKRALLLIPVISVLLLALAVPAFADYSPETGWDAPVGTFEPFVADVLFNGQLVPFSLGSPFESDGGEINFPYKLVFNSWPERASSDTAVILGQGFVLHVSGIGEDGVAYDNYYACNYLRLTSGNSIDGQGLGHILYFKMVGSDFEVQVNLATQNAEFYLMLYPFGEAAVGQALEGYSFEVYEAASAPSSDSVTSVWTEIMTWITSALNSVMGAFYVDGSLTLLGTLAVIGVSVGIGFILIGLIQRFLKLRG